jgi:hypothetical protein
VELERARIRCSGEVAPERFARELAEDLARILRALGLLDANGASRSAVVLNCTSGTVDAPTPSLPVPAGIGPKREEPASSEPGRMRIAQARGTVLVDVSNSMSLADADLERLLSHAARGTCVAKYSGSGNDGELRIVAQNGRRAEGEALARLRALCRGVCRRAAVRRVENIDAAAKLLGARG